MKKISILPGSFMLRTSKIMFSGGPKRLNGFLSHPFEYVFANVKLWRSVSQLIQSKFSSRKPTCFAVTNLLLLLPIEENFAQRNCNEDVSFKNSTLRYESGL